jgi:hypothetical protein
MFLCAKYDFTEFSNAHVWGRQTDIFKRDSFYPGRVQEAVWGEGI